MPEGQLWGVHDSLSHFPTSLVVGLGSCFFLLLSSSGWMECDEGQDMTDDERGKDWSRAWVYLNMIGAVT